MSVAPSTLPHGNEAYTPRLRRVLNPLDSRNVQYLEEVELPEGVLNGNGNGNSNGSYNGNGVGNDVTALAGRRQEMAALQAMLDQKDEELESAKLTIREKEQELQLVREEMARQEGQLRVTKSELIETRMQVQEKDSQLKQAYEALTLASRERSKLRQALLETEQEVTSNRQHMMHFYSGLAEIHNVMGEVEDELDNILAEQGEEGIGGGDDGADDPMTSLLGYGRAMLQPNKEEEEAATVEVLREISELSETISREAVDDLENYYQVSGQENTTGNVPNMYMKHPQ